MLQAPAISPLGNISATPGTSATVADRGAPMMSIVGLVIQDLYMLSNVSHVILYLVCVVSTSGDISIS